MRSLSKMCLTLFFVIDAAMASYTYMFVLLLFSFFCSLFLSIPLHSNMIRTIHSQWRHIWRLLPFLPLTTNANDLQWYLKLNTLSNYGRTKYSRTNTKFNSGAQSFVHFLHRLN